MSWVKTPDLRTSSYTHIHPKYQNFQVFAEDGEEVWRKQENIALGAVRQYSLIYLPFCLLCTRRRLAVDW